MLTSRRLIATRRSPALLPAVVVLVLLAIPAVAGAHLRSGTVAVDYRASVTTRDPAAYTAQIFQSDRALNMTVKPGHIVVLVGYLGEPVFRLDDAGLWVNAASPTAVVLRLLAKSERVVGSAPHWRLQPRRQSVVWQDARTQGLPPGVRHGSWAVPVIVDGRRSRLQGELWHFAYAVATEIPRRGSEATGDRGRRPLSAPRARDPDLVERPGVKSGVKCHERCVWK